MYIVDQLVSFFQKPEEETKGNSPQGLCPVCWGYQEYDGKIRKLFKDKQIDVNNHRDSYMLLQDFVVNHIKGIKLKDSVTESCPDCGSENKIG